jgi:hypothetical protein
MSSESKDRLVSFLDRKVFDPVLKKSADDYSSDTDKQKFEEIKRATEKEKERFHKNYSSAQEVRQNFLRDLTSEPAKKIHRKEKDLNLPTLPDVKEEFLKLCDKYNVK